MQQMSHSFADNAQDQSQITFRVDECADTGYGRRMHVECEGLSAMSDLALRDSIALAVLTTIMAHAGDQNIVVVSLTDLSTVIGRSEDLVLAAVDKLRRESWISVKPIDACGAVSEYTLNPRVGWSSQIERRPAWRTAVPLRLPKYYLVNRTKLIDGMRKLLQVVRPLGA